MDKFSYCPVCNNRYNNPDAIVCRYCGHTAFNLCTNEECKRKCEPDSYYCELCGSKTILGRLENH